MRRCISLLLVLATLFAMAPLCLSEAAEPAQDAVDEAALQDGLDYALTHTEIMHPLADENENEASEAMRRTVPAKRDAADNNLLVPGPLMEGCGAKQGDRMLMRMIRFQTGKAGQKQIVLIFRGTDLSKEPVEVLFNDFDTTEGIFESTGIWETEGVQLGTYTAVTCTADSEFRVIEGTASAEQVYVLDHDVRVQSIYFTDLDGNRLSKATLTASGPSYVCVKHEPAITTYTPKISISIGRPPAGIQQYSGLLILEPRYYGWGSASISCENSQISRELPFEICVHADGHRAEETELLKPAQYIGGGSISYCPDCHTSHISETKSNCDIYYTFNDIPRSAWYCKSVRAAVEYGLFNGVSETKFAPEGTMTRAMLVTVLWRYAGELQEGANVFSDVPAGKWYTAAVAWAAKNRVVDGVGNGEFAPEDTITREQLATIIYRYAAGIGADVTERADLAPFADGDAVSRWATEAMQWCVSQGLIGGYRSGDEMLLEPKGSATRAQVAAVLMRFIEKMNPVEELDTTGALDSGSLEGDPESKNWAFFPDGTLVLAGDDLSVHGGAYAPWSKYISDIKTVRFLYGVKTIWDRAFADYYRNLETVEMSDRVSLIGKRAFANCSALKTIRWPKGRLDIDSEAFCGCIALEEVVLPDGVYRVDQAFRDCINLKKIVFPDSLYTHAIDYKGEVITAICDGCTALTEVRLPVGMMQLPESFFRNCVSLQSVELPRGMSSIYTGAFDGCAGLKTLVLPVEVHELWDEAFCADHNFRGNDYVDTCGLTDLYILNPLLTAKTDSYDRDRHPVYYAPFGNPEKVTVHAYAGTAVEALAKEMGYRFVPLPEQ